MVFEGAVFVHDEVAVFVFELDCFDWSAVGAFPLHGSSPVIPMGYPWAVVCRLAVR